MGPMRISFSITTLQSTSNRLGAPVEMRQSRCSEIDRAVFSDVHTVRMQFMVRTVRCSEFASATGEPFGRETETFGYWSTQVLVGGVIEKVNGSAYPTICC